MPVPLAGRLRAARWSVRVASGVIAATLGVLLGAAAARRGGFLARDVEVAEPPPLTFGSPRWGGGLGGWLRGLFGDGLIRWNPDLEWLGRIVEIALQTLLAAVVLAVVAAVGYEIARGLLAIRALMLRRWSATETTTGYDPGERTPDDTATQLRLRASRVVEVGEVALDELTDPAEAVLACYVAMERAAAAAGTGRRPHETPHDLLRRVLAEQAVAAPSAGELTALYEQVRYGARSPDEPMRARARRCLRAIRADLDAAR